MREKKNKLFRGNICIHCENHITQFFFLAGGEVKQKFSYQSRVYVRSKHCDVFG